MNKALIHAEDEATQMGDEYISVEHIFLALIKQPNREVKAIFKEFNINKRAFPSSTFYRKRESEESPVTIRRQPMIRLINTAVIW